MNHFPPTLSLVLDQALDPQMAVEEVVLMALAAKGQGASIDQWDEGQALVQVWPGQLLALTQVADVLLTLKLVLGQALDPQMALEEVVLLAFGPKGLQGANADQ